MRRVYYAFLLRQATHPISVHLAVLALSVFALSQIISIPSVLSNLLKVEVGRVAGYLLEALLQTQTATIVLLAVIMVTIHEDNDRIADALRHGASGYLSKRASADEVVQGIRDVMRGGAAMSPQIARRVLNIFAQLNAPGVDYGLTNREKDVLNELVAGKTKKRIARDLSLSIYTVDTHLRSVYTKLHVNTQTAAVAKALKEGILR